jgi:tetratricopeptide (TPR) repeat protein
LWIDNQPDEALTELQDAILLNPGDALTYAYMAGVLTTAGRPADAMPHIERAMRLDPKYPSEFAHILAMAQFAQERYQSAADSLETAIKLNSGDENHFLALAATYGHLGRRREAMSAIARYNAIRATFKGSPTSVSESPRMRFRRNEDVKRFRSGLRLAGMPETPGAWLWQAEISKLLFGHKIQGINPETREEYVAEFASDGKVAMSGEWGTGSSGSVRLDQYQLCIVWSDSRNECVSMFRNAGGKKAESNEYVWLTINGSYPFSVVE